MSVTVLVQAAGRLAEQGVVLPHSGEKLQEVYQVSFSHVETGPMVRVRNSVFRHPLYMLLVNSAIVHLISLLQIKATAPWLNIKGRRVEILYFISHARWEALHVETTRLCHSPVVKHWLLGACDYRRLWSNCRENDQIFPWEDQEQR